MNVEGRQSGDFGKTGSLQMAKWLVTVCVLVAVALLALSVPLVAPLVVSVTIPPAAATAFVALGVSCCYFAAEVVERQRKSKKKAAEQEQVLLCTVRTRTLNFAGPFRVSSTSLLSMSIGCAGSSGSGAGAGVGADGALNSEVRANSCLQSLCVSPIVQPLQLSTAMHRSTLRQVIAGRVSGYAAYLGWQSWFAYTKRVSVNNVITALKYNQDPHTQAACMNPVVTVYDCNMPRLH